MTSWFRSALKNQPTLQAEEEDLHLQHVESALLQLLNDDIAAADKILKEQESSYHHLGRGISSFLASMLGAEKELLKDACTKLLASETKNWEDMKKAQKEPTAYRSAIYPPGTEYLLCYAGMFMLFSPLARFLVFPFELGVANSVCSLSTHFSDMWSYEWFSN